MKPLASAFLVAMLATSQVRAMPASARTRWRVYPSMTFDALCLAGVLSGDPFYDGQYDGPRAKLTGQMTREVPHDEKRPDRQVGASVVQ